MKKFLFGIFLLILTCLADSLTSEGKRRCQDRGIHCGHMRMYTRYPENAEELLQVCKKEQAFWTCYANAIDNCDPKFADNRRIGVDYLKSVCKKDDPIFKAISSNLQCMVPAFRHLYTSPAACYKIYGNESRSFYMKYITPDEFEICVNIHLYTACETLTYGQHCGSEVTDAYENFSNHYYGAGYNCAKHYPEIVPVVETYKTMLIKEMLPNNNY